MKNIKRHLVWSVLLCLLTGCSPDIREISDIALVMISGIDYDEQKSKYIITAYCIQATTKSTEKTGKIEWVASASGDSIMDATRNLRSRAGKILIGEHNKFIVIGESAARHSFYEIVDYLTRAREVRMSSYVFISEGMAADKMMIKSESGDLMSNEFLGKIMNENVLGNTLSLKLKDIANYCTDPYRGFVTSKLGTSKPKNSAHEVLILSGGSVFNKGKLVGWLMGKDVLSLHMLTKKKESKNLEYPVTVSFKSSKVTLLLNATKKTIHSGHSNGKPMLAIDLHFRGKMVNMNRSLPVADPVTLRQLERAAAEHIEESLKESLAYFQNELKVDVVGFSDYFSQHDPNEWKRIKNEWTNVYPSIPIKVNVDVNIFTPGMSETLGGN
ncbi:Ger(x)C family spore germination protein [Paenibacillus sp. V4I5]|uniref:Ger(x)C family spore germination protein n=1 Tax=Paenibacillus sp. V4I5 TaxID=3042306 RepID=UPI0027947AF9|nr:Ger(x)C family spore germination protein [Paenibacillus sp. V4I5]MDQ0916090.1 spore germination protein KC [Paenibacillus sp. V4I5]